MCNTLLCQQCPHRYFKDFPYFNLSLYNGPLNVTCDKIEVDEIMTFVQTFSLNCHSVVAAAA